MGSRAVQLQSCIQLLPSCLLVVLQQVYSRLVDMQLTR